LAKNNENETKIVISNEVQEKSSATHIATRVGVKDFSLSFEMTG